MNKFIENICSSILDNIDVKQFKHKTVLVTGANGLIGGFLADFFYYLNVTHDYNIKIVLTSLSRLPNRLQHILDDELNNVDYIPADLAEEDIDIDLDFVETRKIDYCFYCAGYAQPAKFLSDPLKTFFLNTNGVNNIFRNIYSKNKNATCVFLSSSEIYTMNENSTSHDESDTINISMKHKRYPYILGKIGGEYVVNTFNELGYDAKSIRVSLCYGPGVSMKDSRVMSELVDKGINQPVIKLFDDGSAARRYLHILDFCIMLFNITLNGKSNTYNVGGTEETTIYEMAKCIGEVFNKPIEKGISNNKVSTSAPKRVWVSLDRYEKEFGTTAIKSFNTGLKEFIEWYKTCSKN